MPGPSASRTSPPSPLSALLAGPGRHHARQLRDDAEPAGGSPGRGPGRPGARGLLGEVYGTAAAPPVGEDAPLRPQNPYAVSKSARRLLRRRPRPARRARASVQPRGTGSGDHFALSSFARQAAAGASEIRTGSLHTRRDFTDVRDVVRAYLELLDDGEPGAVYNVCSGRSTSTAELVALVARAAGRELTPVPDPACIRPPRGHRPLRRPVPPPRGHGLGARDPPRADRSRHPRVVGGRRLARASAGVAQVVRAGAL